MRLSIAATLALPALLYAQPTQPEASLSASLSPPVAHLEIRQGPGVTAPIAPTAVTQVSPTTTMQIGSVQVVYTQLFVTPLDQWPAPTAGSIGLGTIQGTIGVVKTKRDAMPAETQVAVVPVGGMLAVEGLGDVRVVDVEENDERKEEKTQSVENNTAKTRTVAGSAISLLLAIAVMTIVA